MLRIILDCDDVLYRTNEVALDRLNEELGTSYVLDDLTKWGSISPELDHRMKYFQDPEFIQAIPVYEGAVDLVSTLAGFCKVILATSVDARCAQARVHAIQRDFPMIMEEDIFICDSKDHLKGDIMLDDGYHNVESSAARLPVLFERPWNRNEGYNPSVQTYGDFLKLILGYRKEAIA